jgi:elongator complex protein 6
MLTSCHDATDVAWSLSICYTTNQIRNPRIILCYVNAMPPSSRIPSHLQPYVHLPRDKSLLLLTSTLGASANWLIIRFLCDALSNTEDGGEEQGHNVVLVSWMKEYEFWKQEARKGGGVDLERLKRDGRFAFVDGLSEVCLNATPTGEATNNGAGMKATPPGPAGVTPGRRVLAPAAQARGPPGPAARTPAPTTPSQAPSTTQSTKGQYTLKSLDVAHIKTTIISVVGALSTSTSAAQRKTLVVLDNPDLLLALDSTIKPSAVTSLILTLHTLPSVSHVLTHIQADNPLLSLSTPPQPLEIAHHNFLVKLGHMSRRILGVRVLDTGVARDVSGVVRVTEQRMDFTSLGFKDEGKESDESGKGKEFLYQVKGDGSVKVFERGAGGDG